MKIYVTIKCNSFALGDTLACVAVVEHYRQTFNLPKIYFDCIDWMWQYLAPAYPNIEFTKKKSKYFKVLDIEMRNEKYIF